MMATPHMMAGAAIGRALHRPWLAWPVAFASHFLLDATPHVDSHTFYGVETGGPTVPEAAIGIADFVAGAVLIGWLVRRHSDRRVVLGGALFGILIDLIADTPLLGPWLDSWPGTAWVGAFHHGIQPRLGPADWLLGFGTQLIVIAVALYAIVLWRDPTTAPRQAQNTRPAPGP